jgi:Recombination endonuclease VII
MEAARVIRIAKVRAFDGIPASDIVATKWALRYLLKALATLRHREKVNHEVLFLQFLYVDHDHRTGEVRGLLCNACNTAIGLLEEDRARISAAFYPI